MVGKLSVLTVVYVGFFVVLCFSQNQKILNLATTSATGPAGDASLTSISKGASPKGIIPSPEVCVDESCGVSPQISNTDREGLEAIRALHKQLDDDANGNVDLSESEEFLREELKYESVDRRRQQAFHQNDDNLITVRELWDAWIRSEVHNWTVEETAEWLTTSVELPQYVPTFTEHGVDGATLPRLAVHNTQYLSSVLKIKDPIHKQKIALKAMDVVLFGAPKEFRNRVKDIILTTLLGLALSGLYYAYRQNKRSQQHLHRMMKDMESLRLEEDALRKLQKELDKARDEQKNADHIKKDLEKQIQSERLESQLSESEEVSKLREELEVTRSELRRAEIELEDKCWMAPPALQTWLQLTYELELKAYNRKKGSAEKQLELAKDSCDKLKKKRSSFVGAFVSAHGKSIDDVDKSILDARTALTEVTHDLQERTHRWKQIEMLCGASIINNPGINVLEGMLKGSMNDRPSLRLFRTGTSSSRLSASQDDLDDSASSLHVPSAAGGCTSTPYPPAPLSDLIPRYTTPRKGFQSKDSASSLDSSSMANNLKHSHTLSVIQPDKEGSPSNIVHNCINRSRSAGNVKKLKHQERESSKESSNSEEGRESSNAEDEADLSSAALDSISQCSVPSLPLEKQNVMFIVGDGPGDKSEQHKPLSNQSSKSSVVSNQSSISASVSTSVMTSSSSPQRNMFKSISQDAGSSPREIQATPKQMSQSESSLDSSKKLSGFPHQKMVLSSKTPPLDEESCTGNSTDSASILTEDDGKKKKKKKIQFPSFSRNRKQKEKIKAS